MLARQSYSQLSVLNRKGRSGRDTRLRRVPYGEGDAPAFCAGPPCRAGEGEDRVPGRSQSAILASSPSAAWCRCCCPEWRWICRTSSWKCRRILHWRGWQGVFSAEEELRGMWSSGALSEEAERSSRSLGGKEGSGVLTLVRVREESWTETVKVMLGRLTTGGWRAGRIGWKSITKTDDHFDLPPFILPSSSRSAWLSGHVSSQCPDVIDVRSAGGRERRGEVRQRFPETEGHVECSGGQGRHRWQTTQMWLLCWLETETLTWDQSDMLMLLTASRMCWRSDTEERLLNWSSAVWLLHGTREIAPSRRVLYAHHTTMYSLQHHFFRSQLQRVHVCFAVTCQRHVWQNAQG